MSLQERSRWRAPELGEGRLLDLPSGKLEAFASGAGEPIVFVHGLLVNANLWRGVIGRLSRDFRCIALDMPLGSHRVPMPPAADLSPAGAAALIGEALEALDLEGATVVGNDTGGALCQIAATTRPERISRLVLTSCDYGDNFPPMAFRPLKHLVKVPGLTQAIITSLRPRPARRLPLAFGWLAKRPIEARAEDSYVLPSLVDPGVRADLRRGLPGINPSYTREAASRLGSFDRPALIAWSSEDRFFPREHAQELAERLPNARLEWIEDSYTFSPEDQPERLAALIADFVREPRTAEVAA